MNKNQLHSKFINPPKGYGEVSFYWWLGDKLTKDRLAWQLDQLENYNIEGLQINYAHSDCGGISYGLPYRGDPPLFSDQWWELFIWFLGEAKKRGMSVSLSDYTISSPGQGFFCDEIIKRHPEIICNEMYFEKQKINKGQSVRLSYYSGSLHASAYICKNNNIIFESKVDLLELIKAEELSWQTNEAEWFIINIYCKTISHSVDMTHPIAGSEYIKEFFQKFADKCPGEEGKGLNYFFSDEMNFNMPKNIWNKHIKNEFMLSKGYDLNKYLPALFIDIGSLTQKVRLDYYDVIVRLEERHFFKPIYDWHEKRGMIQGCDHGGRGKNVVEFGDYFRTQRWNQGPGNDQPKLASDIIKNKIASSIAHIYKRQRVWLEGFYGSGWGTSSSDIIDAVFRNFASGHNLLTLHGLYYSTHGGWWEWAPPCNHFRQPYWRHMHEVLLSFRRLGYLLSQGHHVCDVAIVYPVAAVEGGLDGNISVNIAFSVGELLYSQGVDFDYVDFESVERAKINFGEMSIAAEKFKIIIIPSMKSIRFSMFKKVIEFQRSGGIVICIGDLPVASDRIGRNDPELAKLVEEISMSGNHVNSIHDALSIIKQRIVPDFRCDSIKNNKTYFMHRRIENADYYFLYGVPKGSVCTYRAKGCVELWSPSSVEIKKLSIYEKLQFQTSIKMPLDESEFQIIVFKAEFSNEAMPYIETEVRKTIPLNGKWGFSITPTLNNIYGDYRLPARKEFIGAEIRKLHHKCDDIHWNEVSCGYGPMFLKLGPVRNSQEVLNFEKNILKYKVLSENLVYTINGNKERFNRYEYSWRFGIESDPGHQGYHGLKGKVSNDFIYTGKPSFTMTSTEYFPEDKGEIYYFWTTVKCNKPDKAEIKIGIFRPIKIWINGEVINKNEVALKRGYNTILLKYNGYGRGHFILESKTASDVRAQSYPLSMQWFRKPGVYDFDIYPDRKNYEEKYYFNSAPGLKKIYINSNGKILAKADGKSMKLLDIKKLTDNNAVFEFAVQKINPLIMLVELSVTQKRSCYGGAAFLEPIMMECSDGLINLGDWSKYQGLYSYSGGACYTKYFYIEKKHISDNIILDLGEVISSVELSVNNNQVGIKSCKPWKFDITSFISEGRNLLKAYVYNTLGNHYTSIPTRYRGNISSGLIGPVTINYEKRLNKM